MIAQMFNPTAELVMPIGTRTNEANGEIETQPLTVKTKTSNFQHKLNTYISSYIFHSLNHYVLFHLKDYNFLFHQLFLI